MKLTIGFRTTICLSTLVSAAVWWFWSGFTSHVVPDVPVTIGAEEILYQPDKIIIPLSPPERIDSELSPDHQYQLDAFWQPGSDLEYYRLIITRLADGRTTTLYRGDSRTMDWKWTATNLVRVDYNCGTGCMFFWVFKVMPQLFLAGKESMPFPKPVEDVVSYRAIVDSPQGKYEGKSEYIRNEITSTSTFSLTVSERDTGRLLTPVRADPRVVNWSWLDEDRIELEYLCGKDCRAKRVVQID